MPLITPKSSVRVRVVTMISHSSNQSNQLITFHQRMHAEPVIQRLAGCPLLPLITPKSSVLARVVTMMVPYSMPNRLITFHRRMCAKPVIQLLVGGQLITLITPKSSVPVLHAIIIYWRRLKLRPIFHHRISAKNAIQQQHGVLSPFEGLSVQRQQVTGVNPFP